MVEHQQKMFMNHEQMQTMQQKMTEMSIIMQELTMENTILKDKNKYLENKISKMIQDLIDLKKSQLS
jgi:ABC-type phosphate transport system auxiliary subunit